MKYLMLMVYTQYQLQMQMILNGEIRFLLRIQTLKLKLLQEIKSMQQLHLKLIKKLQHCL